MNFRPCGSHSVRCVAEAQTRLVVRKKKKKTGPRRVSRAPVSKNKKKKNITETRLVVRNKQKIKEKGLRRVESRALVMLMLLLVNQW